MATKLMTIKPVAVGQKWRILVLPWTKERVQSLPSLPGRQPARCLVGGTELGQIYANRAALPQFYRLYRGSPFCLLSRGCRMVRLIPANY
jgi:hypothetical protein